MPERLKQTGGVRGEGREGEKRERGRKRKKKKKKERTGQEGEEKHWKGTSSKSQHLLSIELLKQALLYEEKEMDKFWLEHCGDLLKRV